MKLFFLFIILGTFFLFSCQSKRNSEEWLKENSIELSQNDSFDFSGLKKAIGNKSIVAIGESSHGLGEFYRLKSALVKYLHEEMGFEVLAMEGGFGDINLAYSNIDSLSGIELRDATLFGNFRAEETIDLFQHIKNSQQTNSPLNYTGYDSQSSSNFLTKTLIPIVKTYNRNLSDSLQYKLWAYGASYRAGSQGDSIDYYKFQKIFLDTASEVEEILTKNKRIIVQQHELTEFQFEIMKRSLQIFQRSYSFSFVDRYQGSELRDKLMWENLRWLMEEVYPEKKFIIWAHNAHIENRAMQGKTIKWMGHFIKENHPTDYYSIGLFAYKGTTYQHWTKDTVAFENNDSIALEHKMLKADKRISFLDISNLKRTEETEWLFQPVQAFELENGGQIQFVPHGRFDAIINVRESGIPTY